WMEFMGLRHDSMALVRSLTAADLERSGEHPKVGTLRVKDLLQEWVHHDRNRTKQILSVVQARVYPHMGNSQKFVGEQYLAQRRRDALAPLVDRPAKRADLSHANVVLLDPAEDELHLRQHCVLRLPERPARPFAAVQGRDVDGGGRCVDDQGRRLALEREEQLADPVRA